jgi:L-lactate dehydrogenase complex protein LldE
VKNADVSTAMADAKVACIERVRLRALVSGDASCLMQIGGRLSRVGSPVRVLHLAELLASTES